MTTEEIFKYVSMISLFIAGGFMLYEGIVYIQLKKSNPSVPDTMYAAATLAIALGIAEIAFGIYHFFM
jgi:hypothetical protein